MLIIGIDPGKSGGIAALSEDGSVETHILKETEADASHFLGRFDTSRYNTFAYLELVHSMPKQGVASSFTFGQSYGFLRGLLIGLGIPFEEVTPQKWQKAMGCRSGGDKNVTKGRAQQLFPGVNVTHAIADAILIAEYGRRLRCGELVEKQAP